MHTAKELHDWLEASNLFEPDARQIILRALSLLASVEDSKLDMVCELRSDAINLRHMDCPEEAETMDSAAALIVEQRQEIERVRGERDSLMAYWFGDWDPEETEFKKEFLAYVDRRDNRAAHQKERDGGEVHCTGHVDYDKLRTP